MPVAGMLPVMDPAAIDPSLFYFLQSVFATGAGVLGWFLVRTLKRIESNQESIAKDVSSIHLHLSRHDVDIAVLKEKAARR